MFGVFDPTPESEKLDIATGGEDIGDPPPLETEEEAEKRQKKDQSAKGIIGQGLK